MRISFLGTSHGYASAQRYCSAAMIETGGSIYYIDAGAPVYPLTLKAGKDMKNVRALFNTHFHRDHIAGAVELLESIDYFERECRIQVFLPEENGRDRLVDFLSAMGGTPFCNERIGFSVYAAGLVYEDEHITVTAYPTRHLSYQNRPSYALLVQGEGKRVLFTGDMSVCLAENDFPAAAWEEENTLIVCEMAHFTPKQAEPYLKKCRTKKLAFTHVYPLENYAGIARLSLPCEVLLPADGDILAL